MATNSYQFTEEPGLPALIPGRKQLLPNIVDGIARTRPNSTFARMSRSATGWEQGVRKITYRELANAVNGAAAWLIEQVGRVEDNGSQAVAYFGLLDARYQVLTLAAIKTGHKVVFPSALQGAEGLAHFLKKVDCSIVVAADRKMTILTALEEMMAQVKIIDAPSLDHLLGTEHPSFPCNKTFEQARNDPFMVLHTSGSTGTPKPIVYTNDWVAAWAAQSLAAPPAGYDTVDYHFHGTELLSFVPPAHVSGLLSMLVSPICHGTMHVYPLPSAPFSMTTMLETLEHCPVDVLLSPPAFLEAIAQDAKLTAFLEKRTRLVGYGGGPLSKRAGDILSTHFMLFPMYGTSENGVQNKLIPPGGWRPEYWADSNTPPSNRAEMRLIPGTENQYEMFIVRAKDPEGDAPIFKMDPSLAEWSSKDVFVGRPFHPANGASAVNGAAGPKMLYSYSHRLADTITLVLPDAGTVVNAKTVNPLRLEQALSGTALIKTALVFGNRKRFPGLLVELADPSLMASTETARQQVLVDVWQEVQVHRTDDIDIQKENIILTTSDRPLPRASKGTVQRAPALLLYDAEIADLYSSQVV